MKTFFNRHRMLILHISFWCVYLSFFFYQISFSHIGEEVDLSQAFLHAFSHVAFVIVAAYLNYFIFLPRFLKHKKLVRYLLEYIPVFSLVIISLILFKRYEADGYTYRENFFYSSRFAIQATLGTLFIVVFVGLLKFAQDWFELESRKKAIENEQLTTELRFLKAQINPHFLFNTLNNLYYLAFIQSPNTPDVICKLSQMMRYMIYDSNHPKVLLSKEIEYMENYILLEKMRLNDPVPIHFEITGNPEEVFVTPLIFITFLENAFKHGVSNNFPGAWINIRLMISSNACIYTVENSLLPFNKLEAEENSGIGLQNVQRRLDLSYPGNYELTTRKDADRYAIQLTLNLS